MFAGREQLCRLTLKFAEYSLCEARRGERERCLLCCVRSWEQAGTVLCTAAARLEIVCCTTPQPARHCCSPPPLPPSLPPFLPAASQSTHFAQKQTVRPGQAYQTSQYCYDISHAGRGQGRAIISGIYSKISEFRIASLYIIAPQSLLVMLEERRGEEIII